MKIADNISKMTDAQFDLFCQDVKREIHSEAVDNLLNACKQIR